jgi:hypothetical protein
MRLPLRTPTPQQAVTLALRPRTVEVAAVLRVPSFLHRK